MPNGFLIEQAPPFDEPDWKSLNLNSSDPDHRIIAGVLALKKAIPRERVCLVTADAGMILTAGHHSIEVITPPSEWLRELKDDRQKELERLERELSRVKDQLPVVDVLFRIHDKLSNELTVSLSEQRSHVITAKEIAEQLDRKRQSRLTFPDPGIRYHPMIPFRAAPDEVRRYEQEFDEYIIRFEQYLVELQAAQKERANLVEAPLTLRNEGNGVADDIDVVLVFPSFVTPLEGSRLPNQPEEPEEPEPPKSPIDQMTRVLRGVDLSPFVGPLVQRWPTPSEPLVEGPVIPKEKPQEAHYWLKTLKHNMRSDLDPFFIRFQWDQARPFGIKYSMFIRNHPDAKRGQLLVKTNDGPPENTGQ